MTPPYLYDPDLAPAEHFQECVERSRLSSPSQASLLSTGGYGDSNWDKYPHSRWPPVSVHTPELNPPNADHGPDWGLLDEARTPPVVFRHSGWARMRGLVRQALLDLDTPLRPLRRFDTCGSDPWVVVDEADSSRLAIHSNHCHSRWCTPCSRERAARIVGNLKLKLTKSRILFLTLTVKHSDAPLSSQIDRIYAAFRKLRRAAFWSSAVDGGCAILELKHSHRTGCWHVHLHCLLQANWVEHADLKAEWWRITGDSNIVDIRPCSGPEHAAHYIVKYITKPVPSSVINKPEQLRQMMSAVSRRRLVLTWGSWRGVRLTEPLDLTAWKSIAPLAELYKRKEAGNLDAYRILSHLETKLPEVRILAGRSPPAPADDPIGTLF